MTYVYSEVPNRIFCIYTKRTKGKKSCQEVLVILPCNHCVVGFCVTLLIAFIQRFYVIPADL